MPSEVHVRADFPPALQCLFKPKRFKVLWGGRGASRSWSVARALLLRGIQQPLRVLCARELQNSIEDSVHRLLADQISLLGLEALYRVEKAHIYGPNGTTFSFEGIRNNITKIKSYEGIDICWVEEAVKVSRTSWGVLIPTIRKEASEIWMTFNPELETDYTFVRFVLDVGAQNAPLFENDFSFVAKMTYRDNPWFPDVLRAEMERDRARDEDYYLNVWEGHCLQALEGAVYVKELRKAQAEGRICTVPWEREWPVSAFFDLGRADATAIWVAQRVAMQTRVLRYFEDTAEEITYYIREMQSWGYTWDTIWLPHDAKAKLLGSKRTIEEIVRQAASWRVRIVPKLSVVDGINAARILFPNCWFDSDLCDEGIQRLRHYRYRVIDGQRSNEPLHDAASDGADAFRSMAIALRQRAERPGVERLMEKLGLVAPVARSRGGEFTPRDGAERLGWMR